jgi:hypothetical protein
MPVLFHSDRWHRWHINASDNVMTAHQLASKSEQLQSGRAALLTDIILRTCTS